MTKEQIVEYFKNIGFNNLMSMTMKEIRLLNINGYGLKEIMNFCGFIYKKGFFGYEKKYFEDFLLEILEIEKPINYKTELKNLIGLNKNQRNLVKLFLEDKLNKNNFKIKKYFTLEDVYFWFVNQGDYNEENAETLLIPKSLIKKETNLIYY